jgi:hypothetical protein
MTFVVVECPGGGFEASALGAAIFTEADSLEQLRERVRDAVRCHCCSGDAPRRIRLRFVREEVIGA